MVMPYQCVMECEPFMDATIAKWNYLRPNHPTKNLIDNISEKDNYMYVI